MSIEELLSRDPLDLTQEEIEENARLMVKLLREERKVWETEKSKAKLTGKNYSGTATKKLQKEAVLKKIRETSVKVNVGDILK